MSDLKNTHRVTYWAKRNKWASPEAKILRIRVSEYDRRVLGEDAPLILAVAAVRVKQLNPIYDTDTAHAAIIHIEEI